MPEESVISVRFFRPSPPLRPYFTAICATTIACGDAAIVEDYLHPGRAALRFTEGPPPVACAVGSGDLKPQWPFVASGPASRAIRFGITRARVWGIGLRPAGWARFVGTPADELADRTVDGCRHLAFAAFVPLLGRILDAEGDAEEIVSMINAFFLEMGHRPAPNERLILACEEALRDPGISGVAELGERLGISLRTLERLCRRHFGFPPRLLLRRQRFLRSLARFMRDPSLAWIEAMDGQYHDQAQFVRDFRSFMGLTPRQYAALPHPILEPIMRQRLSDQGTPPPRRDLPAILRCRPDLPLPAPGL